MKWTWIAEMPSTNVRIGVTMVLALATGCKVIAVDWSPPFEWLGFLSLWAGLDVAQFWAKRVTHQPGTSP